jgi:hypothetical protein
MASQGAARGLIIQLSIQNHGWTESPAQEGVFKTIRKINDDGLRKIAEWIQYETWEEVLNSKYDIPNKY